MRTFNRTGLRYKDHFDIWLINELQELREATAHLIPDAPLLSGWINDNLYQRAKESFNILPIPSTIINSLTFLPHNDPSVITPTPLPQAASTSNASQTNKRRKKSQPLRHAYLAEKQGTKIAVIHVHTAEERILFKFLLSKPQFVRSDWKAMAREWVQYADGFTIFYKVCISLPDHDFTLSLLLLISLDLLFSYRSIFRITMPCGQSSRMKRNLFNTLRQIDMSFNS